MFSIFLGRHDIYIVGKLRHSFFGHSVIVDGEFVKISTLQPIPHISTYGRLRCSARAINRYKKFCRDIEALDYKI